MVAWPFVFHGLISLMGRIRVGYFTSLDSHDDDSPMPLRRKSCVEETRQSYHVLFSLFFFYFTHGKKFTGKVDVVAVRVPDQRVL